MLTRGPSFVWLKVANLAAVVTVGCDHSLGACAGCLPFTSSLISSLIPTLFPAQEAHLHALCQRSPMGGWVLLRLANGELRQDRKKMESEVGNFAPWPHPVGTCACSSLFPRSWLHNVVSLCGSLSRFQLFLFPSRP